MVRAQGGDEHAFEALSAATHPRLYRVALGILRDPSHAEDATQQAIINIWRHLPRLRDPARFASWSYKVLVNACADQADASPRWLPEEALPPARIPRADDGFGPIHDRDQLERAFARLSVEHRAVIVMRYLLDMSQEQVAAALDIPLGTVGSRLSRAMAAMRAALEADARRQEDPTRAAALR